MLTFKKMSVKLGAKAQKYESVPISKELFFAPHFELRSGAASIQFHFICRASIRVHDDIKNVFESQT